MTVYCRVCGHEEDAHLPYKATQFCMGCAGVHDFEVEIA